MQPSILNLTITEDEAKKFNHVFKGMIDNNFRSLKGIVRNTLESGGENRYLSSPQMRMQHIYEVVKISKLIVELWKRESTCSPQLKLILDRNLEWTIFMVAYLHDMYKFNGTDVYTHGKLAAEQLRLYCKMRHIRLDGVFYLMYEALTNHSTKNIVLGHSNVYLDILQDSDVLSKYTIENVTDKHISRFNSKGTIYDAMNDTLERNGVYNPSTPVYSTIKSMYAAKLTVNVKLASCLQGGE